MTSVYDFSKVTAKIECKGVGKCTITGKGVGSISVSRANDQTQHDVAADGSVMVSKMITKNGSVALSIQQTSEANAWLLKWYKYLTKSDTKSAKWIATTITIKTNDGTIVCHEVSPQKRPDIALQQTGQQITWNMLSAKITG